MSRTFPLVAVALWFSLLGESLMGAPAEFRVLVLPFDNSTGKAEYEVLREGLADLLVSSLSSTASILLVDRRELDRALRERKLQLSGLMEPLRRLELGRILSARFMVSGGFALFDGRFTLNAHVVDVETAELVVSETVSGEPERLAELVDQLASRLRRALPIDALLRRELRPEHQPETRKHFVRGLGYYHGALYDQAIAEFMQALLLDADYPDARFWLARSYLAAAETDHARIELERFIDQFSGHALIAEAKKLLRQISERSHTSE
jgi:TolB-like protein